MPKSPAPAASPESPPPSPPNAPAPAGAEGAGGAAVPTSAPLAGEAEALPEPAATLPEAPPADHRAGFVALVGRPNVGKSSLLNALVGEKVAIVSPKPQTTRRRLVGILSTPSAQAAFLDTPGLHAPVNALGQSMVRAARSALADADLIVWVVDVSRAPEAEDERIAALVRGARRPTLIAMNKSDLLAAEDVLGHTAAYADLVRGAEWMLTIATAGHNLERLWAMIAAALPPSPPLYPPDQLSDQTDRDFAAEIVREAALRYLHEEVPHGVDVVVEEWSEQPNGILHVAAKLTVERERHKAIVIGGGGAMLKKIGSSARRELERAWGRRIYLELFVNVREGWRRDAGDLRRMGYR